MRCYKFKYALDHPLRSIEHKSILQKKKFLKRLYTEWYNIFRSLTNGRDKYLELGSGGGFIKDIIPNIITSDINEIPGIDKFFSATQMPFEDDYLAGIFMIDSFHHFPNVKEFLAEAQRVLKKNGKIVMIEPWYTKWSGFIYRKFHHELFDPNRDWFFPLKGPLSGSNMALAFIVFKRDIDKYKHEFPNLKINRIEPHTPFGYLFSGGFSRRAILPNFIINCIHYIENHIVILKNKFAMFVTIEIEKVK